MPQTCLRWRSKCELIKKIPRNSISAGGGEGLGGGGVKLGQRMPLSLEVDYENGWGCFFFESFSRRSSLQSEKQTVENLHSGWEARVPLGLTVSADTKSMQCHPAKAPPPHWRHRATHSPSSGPGCLLKPTPTQPLPMVGQTKGSLERLLEPRRTGTRHQGLSQRGSIVWLPKKAASEKKQQLDDLHPSLYSPGQPGQKNLTKFC